MTAQTASALDDDTLARLRAEARAAASPFIDPALLREASSLLPAVDLDWLGRVTGHPVASWRTLDNAGLHLAVAAVKADAEHLEAVRAQRRDEELHKTALLLAKRGTAAQATRDAWKALRSRLPVPVAVCHNWTARHLDGYEQGADHIVILADLDAGRLHRKAGDPLCLTPSRVHELRYVGGNAGDEKRLPTCKACLRHAEKLAGNGSEEKQ